MYYQNSVCDNGIIRKTGAAIQYLNRSDGYKECEVIGHYDSSRDDTYFSVSVNIQQMYVCVLKRRIV